MNCSRLGLGGLVMGLSAGLAFGQTTKPARATATTPAAAAATATAPVDEVAVIVNGKPIMESQIDKTITEYVLQRSLRGQEPSRADLVRARQQLQSRNQMGKLYELVINNELVMQAAKQAGTMLTDKQFEAETQKQLDERLEATGTSRETASEQIKRQFNKTLDEYVKDLSQQTGWRVKILQEKAMQKKYANELKVTDDDVRKYYDENLQTRYTLKEPQVQASHILFATQDLRSRQPLSDEAKKEKRKKAEEVLAEAKKPGADFAALAKQYSEDPRSKVQGGDLGFFGQKTMVKPFADAAFGMKVGDISDIVESNFGYHIIKVTGRREPGPVPFDQVKDDIRKQLEQTKSQKYAMQYRDDLEQAAKVVYPPGKELATRPATVTTRPVVRPPTTMPRPAGRSPATGQGRGTIRLVPKPQPSTAK